MYCSDESGAIGCGRRSSSGKTEDSTNATRSFQSSPLLRQACRPALDQFPLNRIHHRFEAVVGSELLIDVVKMIAKGLRTDG